MADIFLIGDTHFGHVGIAERFTLEDGSRARPYTSVQEMDEDMVAKWNSVVKPNDKVYHLGDVVINRKALPIMNRLNGTKRLIRGNHDIFPTSEYLKYFKEVYGVRVLDDMILSHIPLHKESVTERFKTNVHGHLHHRIYDEPEYFCVSAERVGYTPIEIGHLRELIKQHKERFGQVS